MHSLTRASGTGVGSSTARASCDWHLDVALSDQQHGVCACALTCRAWACAQDYQRLLASQPSRRLNPSKLAESAALKTRLVDAISFMESLAVKDSNEKDLFFKRLPAVIPTLPPPVARRKVPVSPSFWEANWHI